MRREEAIIYVCDHCNKISRNKGAMNRHEATCNKNPDNHAICTSCIHLTKKCVGVISDSIGLSRDLTGTEVPYEEAPDYRCIGYGTYTKTTFVCDKTGKGMWHPKIKRVSKEKQEEIKKQSDMPMPKECEYFTREFADSNQ